MSQQFHAVELEFGMDDEIVWLQFIYSE